MQQMKIYTRYLFCFFSLFGIAQSNFQKDTIPTSQINVLNSEYKDYVYANDIIYAISKNDDLVAINLKKDRYKLIKNNIVAIAMQSTGELLFGSSEGKLFTFNKKGKIKQIDEIDAQIFSILINSKDEYIVYSNKSIYYDKKHYVPTRATNFYGKVKLKLTGTTLIAPDYIYLDKMNFIWFTFNEGEWGGNVCFFDLDKKEFIYEKQPFNEYPTNLHISSNTKGVTYNSDNELFITSSGGSRTFIYTTLNEFDYYVSGTVSKIFQKGEVLHNYCFDPEFLEDKKYKFAFSRDYNGFKNNDSELREILTANEINKLGTITYNKFNNQLYFFSTKGFSILKNSDCTFIKKLYLSPKLTCKTQNTRSYCIDLLVTKFEFISEKEMIFLTKNDGIGYYNGENIKYFK